MEPTIDSRHVWIHQAVAHQMQDIDIRAIYSVDMAVVSMSIFQAKLIRCIMGLVREVDEAALHESNRRTDPANL